jgi:hypothetical protein
MRFVFSATTACVVIVIAGCSSGPSLQDFSTKGVVSPEASCSTDPREFANAERLGTHGQGICTVTEAYRVHSIEGIALSQPAIMNCATANALRQWVKSVLLPNAKNTERQGVASLNIAASYACRARNGRRGAKLSEHGFGNAVDVSAITLSDGRTLSVRDDYYRSAMLKSVRKASCSIFSTVLGPGSDRAHHDHFHFDLAYRRSGQSFCR